MTPFVPSATSLLLQQRLQAMVAVLAMWIAILLVSRMDSRGGGSGFARDTLTPFMGPIVIAMGMQSALAGSRSLMTIG